MPKNCEYPSDNHSKDIIAVYYGETKPLIVCGYHNTNFSLVKLSKVIKQKRAN